jgi:hypothetical protein
MFKATSQAPCIASRLLPTTSIVRPYSSVGLNSITSVPAVTAGV